MATILILLLPSLAILGMADAAHANGQPMGTQAEYFGHFGVGCVGYAVLGFNGCPQVDYYPNHPNANFIQVGNFGGWGTAVNGNVDVCALNDSGSIITCFDGDGDEARWIPAGTTEWAVFIPGTANAVPSVDIDYVVWLRCTHPDDVLSQIDCTP